PGRVIVTTAGNRRRLSPIADKSPVIVDEPPPSLDWIRIADWLRSISQRTGETDEEDLDCICSGPRAGVVWRLQEEGRRRRGDGEDGRVQGQDVQVQRQGLR